MMSKGVANNRQKDVARLLRERANQRNSMAGKAFAVPPSKKLVPTSKGH
ncbi:MAG: hypothetical protein V2A70_01440 [Candidatus Omnitrophota bacterium]